jgi:hypothetical protein
VAAARFWRYVLACELLIAAAIAWFSVYPRDWLVAPAIALVVFVAMQFLLVGASFLAAPPTGAAGAAALPVQSASRPCCARTARS